MTPTTALVPLVHRPRTLIDEADRAAVEAAGPWHLSVCDGRWYAGRTVRQMDGTYRTQRLHTFLTGWAMVDHANGDGLDNRRSNLRAATPSLNGANRDRRRSRSGYRGVYWHVASQSWQARITVGGRPISLRYHPTAEAAARAYDRAAREHFGDFARPNFPKENAA